RAVDDEVRAQGGRLLQVGRGERVVHREQRTGLVRQLGNGGDVDNLQQRVRRRLDPDEPCCRREDVAKAAGASVLGVTGGQAPRLEDPLEQAERAAVQVGRRGHLVAGLEQPLHHRGRRGQPRREGQAAFAAFEGGQARL